jgi:hypothetical protein
VLFVAISNPCAVVSHLVRTINKVDLVQVTLTSHTVTPITQLAGLTVQVNNAQFQVRSDGGRGPLIMILRKSGDTSYDLRHIETTEKLCYRIANQNTLQIGQTEKAHLKSPWQGLLRLKHLRKDGNDEICANFYYTRHSPCGKGSCQCFTLESRRERVHRMA